MPVAEVARRLGDSIDVLMRVYAGVLVDEQDRRSELIDAEMDWLAEDRPAEAGRTVRSVVRCRKRCEIRGRLSP